MPKRFTLNDDQRKQRIEYQLVGWPETLTLDDLVIYEMKSAKTLDAHYFSREDCPSVPDAFGTWVPRKDWDAFKSAVARRRRYAGLEGVMYE
ncbi:hypothetical protein [Weissella tructae]